MLPDHDVMRTCMQHPLLFYKWWVLKTAWLLGVELVGYSGGAIQD